MDRGGWHRSDMCDAPDPKRPELDIAPPPDVTFAVPEPVLDDSWYFEWLHLSLAGRMIYILAALGLVGLVGAVLYRLILP